MLMGGFKDQKEVEPQSNWDFLQSERLEERTPLGVSFTPSTPAHAKHMFTLFFLKEIIFML